MWGMPPDFVSLVFHVYFSYGLLMCLSTCISGGYHVMFEPRFPSDVYSTWGFLMWIIYVGLHIHAHYTWLHNATPVRYRTLCASRGPSQNITLSCWSDPPHTYVVCHFCLVVYTLNNLAGIRLIIGRCGLVVTVVERWKVWVPPESNLFIFFVCLL